MTRKDIINYLGNKVTFREEKAERSYPGSSSVLKNELYAYALGCVIEYVTNLPDDDPTLRKLEEAEGVNWFDDDSELHAHTIHCSLGKPADIPKWFSKWAGMVIREGGAK